MEELYGIKNIGKILENIERVDEDFVQIESRDIWDIL